MQPYVAGKPIDEVKRELGLDQVVKLASNENPLGPSPKAVEAVKAAAHSMHLYPDAAGFALKSALAERHKVSVSNVLLGNGSDELIALLGMVLLQPGDSMVVADPTFVRYAASAELAGCEVVRVPLDEAMQHDIHRMVEALSPTTRLVYVANPHNPTGTVVSAAAIDRLVEALPTGATLVLDEAYYEYTDGVTDRVDSLSYVRRGLPVVALRTFSKAYGLAGIRVGYGFASEDLVDAVNRAREPFDVNALAQAAAIAALGDDAYLAESVAWNREGIGRIARAVEALGYKTVTSHANFVLVKVDRAGTEVFQQMLKHGVIVRAGEPLGLPGTIRVSVGTAEEIDRFVAVFTQVMKSPGPTA